MPGQQRPPALHALIACIHPALQPLSDAVIAAPKRQLEIEDGGMAYCLHSVSSKFFPAQRGTHTSQLHLSLLLPDVHSHAAGFRAQPVEHQQHGLHHNREAGSRHALG